jgi:hypothetical protein
MNESEFRQSIVSAFNQMKDLQLTDWGMFPNQRQLKRNDEFLSVALDSNSRYEDVYRNGIGLLHYNFILNDHSYFQFNMSQGGKKFRFAFYANPYELSGSFAEVSRSLIESGESPMLGDLYDQLIDEAELRQLIPPVRYDYDPNSYTETKHPAGHLHIGIYQGSRLAVRRILDPLTFTLFIAKHFYSTDWSDHDLQKKNENGYINLFDNKLADAKRTCSLVDNVFFSQIDEALLYLD